MPADDLDTALSAYAFARGAERPYVIVAPRGWRHSWRLRMKERRERELLRRAATSRGSWGLLLAKKALRYHDRHVLKLAVRAMKDRHRAFGITPAAGPQTLTPQIPITDTPIEPMAPTALTIS